jgi:predicted secreted protein
VTLVWPDFFIVFILKNALMAGENIAMNVGDTKTITLPGGGTTGYSWSYKTAPDGVVKVSSMAKTATAGAKGPVGGTNDDVFTISAIAKGSATVTFSFGRNWEDKEAKKTNIYEIRVS